MARHQDDGLRCGVTAAATVGALACALAANAQAPPVEAPVWKDTVVVTAARFEQGEEEVPANVTVLTEEEIRGSAALSVDDFLRRVPGFSLFRRSSSLVAHPTTQGVSLRGIGPSGVSRTLVLLDGTPINDPFGGWVYWSRVPLESVERVEIVRGGTSSLWGNFALGGVVQLITRPPADGNLRVAAEAGERGTARLDVSAGDRWERSALQLYGSAFDTDGYPIVAAEQRGAIDVPAFSEHRNAGGRVEVLPSDSWDLTVRGSWFDEERGNGTPLTGNDTETGAAGARLVGMSRVGEWRISLFGQDQTFASAFSAQQSDRSSERPALDQFAVDSEGYGLGAQWLSSFTGGRVGQTITAGSELRSIDGATHEDFFFSGDAFQNRRRAGGEQRLYGIFLQDSLDLGARWSLQLGARVDRWESFEGLRLETRRESGAVLREELPADRHETELSPRLALLYQPRQGVGLRASLYQAFRAPTINELYRPFRVRNDITEANALLEPETLQGAELGADIRGRRARGKLTAFWNEVDDPIANVTLAPGPGVIAPCGFVPAGGTCRQRQNLERTRIRGLEAEIEVRPDPHWRFVWSYLLSDPEIVEAPRQPELEGNRLAQVPESQLVFVTGYSHPRTVDVAVIGRFVDEQFEDDLNSPELELNSVVTVDLALSVPVNRRLDVFVRAENLFDKTIEVGKTGEGLVTVGMPFLIHGGLRLALRR